MATLNNDRHHTHSASKTIYGLNLTETVPIREHRINIDQKIFSLTHAPSETTERNIHIRDSELGS